MTDPEQNPYEPPPTPLSGQYVRSSPEEDQEDSLPDPVVAYTADSNLEAHSLVAWLQSHGIRSHAVEDNSGFSLFALGTISQFHKPQVFVAKSDLQRTGELLREFESQRGKRRRDDVDAAPINAECEECGAVSEFPASQDGTTQNCPQCHAYIDVGSIDWPDDFDFGEVETEPTLPDNAEQAIDAAFNLDKSGEWDAAIAAYRIVAERWPEHATYAGNCIAEIQGKIDASE